MISSNKTKYEAELSILKSNFDIQTIQFKRALEDQVEIKLQLEKYKQKLQRLAEKHPDEHFSQKEIFEDLLKENSRQLEEQKDINSALEVINSHFLAN
jgi:hypothetical protein